MVSKMTVADSCILATATLVFIVMIFVTKKVFKLVDYADRRLMFMLVFLDITLICNYLHCYNTLA